MLVFYYNLKNNKVPSYLTSFLPNTSIARERYPIRNPRLQPPICSHEYISKTCKYRLPVLLNSINNNSVVQKFGAMHIIYQINRLTTTKVDSTYLC